MTNSAKDAPTSAASCPSRVRSEGLTFTEIRSDRLAPSGIRIKVSQLSLHIFLSIDHKL